MLYFDHAATTLIYPEVLALLHKNLSEDFANPSSNHSLGQNLSLKIDEARQFFLKTLGAHSDDQFIFTSSATESNNTVIKGFEFSPGDTILYSKADHPSIVAPVESLKSIGVELIPILLLKNGTIDYQNLESVLSQKKITMAIFSKVNHQSGNIYDINRLAILVKKFSPLAHIHVDAVQAFLKIDFKISKEIDSVSVTAHKIGGPKGIAGLYLRKNTKIKPLLLGGSQQDNFRAGTESFPLVNAFLLASQISLKNREVNFSEILKIKNMIIEKLSSINSIQFIFEETSPYIISFILPGISSDIILRHLEVKNIFIGSTSACSSRIKSFNPTLDAFHLPINLHKNILRISLGPTTNQVDSEAFLHAFLITWQELRFLMK
jgi:cysteine desulfurase